jgi:hypothetical protein
MDLCTGGTMKRNSVYSAILILVIFAFASAQEKITLTEFVSAKGGFSVKMPGKPEDRSEQVDSADGPLDVHTFALDVGKNGYVVQYNDYSDPVTKDEIEKILSAVRDGGSKQIQGKIVSEKTHSRNGFPGKSIQVESGDLVYFEDCYLAGQRLYQVIFSMPVGDKMPPEAEEFRSSFQIKQPSH